MKQKLMITGVFGFIFSNFIRMVLQEKLHHDYDFCLVDKITNNTLLHNYHANKAFGDLYIADVKEQHVINRIFELEKPDIIIHAAAESSVDFSLENPNIFVESNVLGTQAMINAAVKYGVKKFIYVSTDEIYGALRSEEDTSWTETSTPDPKNPYSASKYAGELLVKAAHNSFGLPYIITRSCNNYGPRQTTNKLIPRVIKCILNDEKIPIYGEGKQIRDWMYVLDNCAAMIKILRSNKINETYNISANCELSNLELVQKICNIMEKGHSLIEHIKDPRPGHDFRYSLNSSKITNELGWKPEFKLSEGLEQCILWFTANKWWFK